MYTVQYLSMARDFGPAPFFSDRSLPGHPLHAKSRSSHRG
jgi:hypothetical protein